MTVLRPMFPNHETAFSREQERELKREAILSAAAQLFDREGVNAARIEDISALLGMSKNSVGYYFESKEEIVAAAYEKTSAFLSEALDAAGADGADGLMGILDCYAGQWIEIAARRRPYVCAVEDLALLPEPRRLRVAQGFSQSIQRLDATVGRWQARAGLAGQRSQPATTFVLSVLEWVGVRLGGLDEAGARAAWGDIRSALAGGVAGGGPLPVPVALGASLPQGTMPAIFDRTTRNAMKREAFLQVAARLFNERGYGGISLGEIAEALGVTRGAFYYHFPDKEALLAECFDRSWRAVQEAFDEAEARGDDPRVTLYSALLRVVYQQASGMTVMMRKALLGALPNAGQMKIRARQAGVQRRIEALLDGGGAGGAEQAKLAFAALFYRGGYALAAASLFDAWPAADSPHAVARGFLAPLMLGLDA